MLIFECPGHSDGLHVSDGMGGCMGKGCAQTFPGPNMKTDSTAKAVVDPSYNYRKITKESPVGVKVILVNRASGVATLGVISPAMLEERAYFDHWAPLPAFKD